MVKPTQICIEVSLVLNVPLYEPIDIFKGLTSQQAQDKRLRIACRKVREICRQNPVSCIGLGSTLEPDHKDSHAPDVNIGEYQGTNPDCLDTYCHDIF